MPVVCPVSAYLQKFSIYLKTFWEPCVKVIDLDRQSAYDIGKMTYSMYKMATAGVPSGTILAVHLQKCSHLSNEIRVMQKQIEFQ